MVLTDYLSGLQHVGIPASSLAESEAFWTKLGFKKIGDFPVGNVIFMQRENLVIESWTGDEIVGKPGAINHISLDVTDAAKSLSEAKKEGFDLIDTEVQTRPFWEKGIKFFNVQGPDGVIVEFCEIVK